MSEDSRGKTLVASSTHYWSPGDEAAFFQWLGSIGCVGELSGHLRDLDIPLVRSPSEDELRELIALFHRYGVDLRQLADLETRKNRKWFRAIGAYWYEGVFGRQSPTPR